MDFIDFSKSGTTYQPARVTARSLGTLKRLIEEDHFSPVEVLTLCMLIGDVLCDVMPEGTDIDAMFDFCEKNVREIRTVLRTAMQQKGSN